jgi:hypothetical protein
MDMSLSFHSAPRAAGPRPRAAALAAGALLAAAALIASVAWRSDDTRDEASDRVACGDLLRGVSKMQLIDLARDPASGGVTCSLRGAAKG